MIKTAVNGHLDNTLKLAWLAMGDNLKKSVEHLQMTVYRSFFPNRI
jgi:hypothetical protein